MPAVTVDNPLVLPRIARPDRSWTTNRPVQRVMQARARREGAGLEVWRPFPGVVPLADSDPLLLLDQLGPLVKQFEALADVLATLQNHLHPAARSEDDRS